MAQSVLELLAGDSEEFQPEGLSALALFPLRAGSLLLAMVITAAYTANLAAFFTKPTWKVEGPKNMDELLRATVCSTIYEEWWQYSEELQLNITSRPSILRPFVGNVLEREMTAECTGGFSTCMKHYCAEALRTGRASIWIDDKQGLHQYQVTTSCHNLSAAPLLNDIMPMATSGYLIALPANRLLVANISAAIAHVTIQPEFAVVMDQALLTRQACTAALDGTDAVTAKSMSGFFIVLAALMLVAILVSLVQAYMRQPSLAGERQLTR
eukprot:9497317-Pyramimonas_sp.AAC.1